MNWERIQLSDLFQVKHGYAFKSAFFEESGPYALLTPGNFHEAGGFRDRGEKQPYYVGDVPEGYVLCQNDLIVAMTEQEHGLLGSSAWISASDRYLHNQRLGRIVKLDGTRLDKRFLYYLFNTHGVRGQIAGSASGTKVRHTSPERIGRVVVDLPSLDVQRRIAGILTDYDDLIENNRQRIVLLEEAARLVYEEWFVHLRFPGSEHTKIVNDVPEGWTKTTAHDTLHILSGGTPKTTNPDFWEGDIPFYTPKDAVAGIWAIDCERRVTEAGLNSCNSRLYPRGTVFISARGTVGKLNMAQRRMAMSQSCYALVGKGHVTQSFVYCAMRAAVAAFQQQAVGAVFDAIVVDTFKRITLIVPAPKMMQMLEEFVQPVFAQTENLTLQNQKLRAARDLLLPRLMDGIITV